MAVTVAVPAAAIKDAGTVALTWELLTSIVARGMPFQCATVLELKLEPFNEMEKLPPPTTRLLGEIDDREGLGFRTSKLRELEVPPPAGGVNTVIEAMPAVDRSDPGTVARRDVPNAGVVVKGVPFQWTTDSPVTKLAPITSKVKLLAPTRMKLGESVDIDGTGFGVSRKFTWYR